LLPYLRRDCDGIYNQGIRDDGIYGLLVRKGYVEGYCEFQKDGHNWMVNYFSFSLISN